MGVLEKNDRKMTNVGNEKPNMTQEERTSKSKKEIFEPKTQIVLLGKVTNNIVWIVRKLSEVEVNNNQAILSFRVCIIYIKT